MTEQHYNTAEIYKALANPKRVAIIEMLAKGEMSVDQISKKLKVPKSNVSQHLSHLRHVGIVKPRRAGLSVFYEIVHGGVKRLQALRIGDIK
ncbi:MAG: metalloregulator ArsR/SmtB family transcription factor [Patescibacteria group bacterium]